MNTFYGLSISNWMIGVVMVLFILVYFIVTEKITKKEEKE